MLTGILISKDGSFKNIQINPQCLDESVENKGNNAIKQLHIFHHDNLQVIYYGWTEGEENNINKCENPPPIDETLYYGDLIVLLREDDELINFIIGDYEVYKFIIKINSTF